MAGLAGLCWGTSLQWEPAPSKGEAGIDVYDYVFPPTRRAGTRSAAPSAQPPQPSHGGQTLGGPAALVGCEDNGTRRGADMGRRRSEKGWSEDWGLEEGGGSCWSQGKGSRHGADSSGGERARQETGCQGFGEVLLQSQLGLQGGRRRHCEIAEQVEASQVLPL